ncbi:MAG: amphi-Trp domain-containing protein [Desulfohalobiaceae bacterium]
MEKVLFKSEEKKDRMEVANFLRELAQKVEQGRVLLRQGSEETAVDIPAQLSLETKLEEESKGTGTKMSLEVELEWPLDAGQRSGSGIELG